MDPDQTAPTGAVCSGPTLFASKLSSSVMLGNYLQQTTFSDAFSLGALRVKGHRELIIYPIDPNGETLVFDSLFCISQHMWGITIKF